MTGDTKYISWAALLAFVTVPSSCELFEDKDENEDEPQQPKTELYAIYAFEGNTSCTGQATATGVVNKGTYVTGVDGNKALELEAGGYLSFPEGMIDQEYSSITFWAKDLYDGHVFHVENSSASSVYVLGVVDGCLRFVRKAYNCNYQFANMPSFGNATLHGWHHIALVASESRKTLYVDGTLCDQLTEDMNNEFNNGIRFVFGGSLNRPYLNGTLLTLDNLRIYRGALSASAVKKIYDSEKPKGFTPGTGANTSNVVNNALYAYFTFNGNATDVTRTGIQSTVSGTTFTDSYNGSGALKIPASGSLSVPEGLIDQRRMSISFWVKDLYDGHVFRVVKSNNDNAFTLTMQDGALKFIATSYHLNYQYSNCSAFMHGSLNGWHMITLTSDFNTTTYATVTTKLYVDGVFVDVVTEDNNPFSESEGTSDQKNYNAGIKFVMGSSIKQANPTTITIDNLRVYKYRAITAEEVKQIYEFEK